MTAVDRNRTIIARYPTQSAGSDKQLPEAPLVRAMLTQHEGTAELRGVDGIQRLYAFAQVRDAAADSGWP